MRGIGPNRGTSVWLAISPQVASDQLAFWLKSDLRKKCFKVSDCNVVLYFARKSHTSCYSLSRFLYMCLAYHIRRTSSGRNILDTYVRTERAYVHYMTSM